jgi:DNA polymerase sigma
MAYVQPTSQEETTRRQVYDFIKKTVKGRFHRSEISLFGSVAHDLCLPDGLVVLSGLGIIDFVAQATFLIEI